MINYLNRLNSIVKFCEDFKEDTIKTAFTKADGSKLVKPSSSDYCWTPRYSYYWKILDGVVSISDMLGIEYLENQKNEISLRTTFLNCPEMISTFNSFDDFIHYVTVVFKEVEDEIKSRINLLEKEEKRRLNEAINCYIQGFNYSTIVMAVSAIEFRLFSLMKKNCPEAKLEDLTLGQMIREYLDNSKKYNKCIPKKHKPLLQHCNVYRIFSVHPKEQKITRSIATSIISMTFEFLLDEKLKRKIGES